MFIVEMAWAGRGVVGPGATPGASPSPRDLQATDSLGPPPKRDQDVQEALKASTSCLS